ncbi:MAG: DNA replication/repair protein RecF [Dehalococcoidia bacterium]|nr:DNA replication/repair protein RecF [Dehalococcoidia bacterium]
MKPHPPGLEKMVYLSHLSLTNFRNFPQLELDLPPGVVTLFGRNAQGKTSLLEAIYLLAIARSFRAENEYEAVNWHTSAEGGFALVAGTIEKESERLRVHVGYQCVPAREAESAQAHGARRPFGVRKQIRVSRVKRSAAELVGLVNAVLFSADDLEIVQGSPSIRRRYLDILISQADSSYLKTLQRYQRVLQNRNRLLKSLQERRAGEDELVFWDEELIKEGTAIVNWRHKAMAILSSLCRESHSELTGSEENLTVDYRPSVPLYDQADSVDGIKQGFIVALKTSRSREVNMGLTAVGPHRDDFKLLVNDVDMGVYGSRGQARTIALAMRLAEVAYLASIRDQGPIVLLDDVLSEMDSFRRNRVLDKTLQYQQVIITTTDLEMVQSGALPNATYYEVQNGSVSRFTLADSLPGNQR